MSTGSVTSPMGGNAVSSIMGIMGSVKEKWDASGASDHLSSLSDQIPQGTKDYFNSASSQLFNRDHLRTVTVCFGIGEEKPFYIEKVPALLVERVRHNISFFYLNYLCVMAVLFVMTLIVTPSAIVGIALLGAAWAYIAKASQNGSISIYGLTVDQKHASIGMGGISVLVLLYLLQNVFWWTLFSSLMLNGAHALFRDASMHKDEGDKVEMHGDLNLIGAGAGGGNNNDDTSPFLSSETP